MLDFASYISYICNVIEKQFFITEVRTKCLGFGHNCRFQLVFLGVSRLASALHGGKCTAVVITIRS